MEKRSSESGVVKPLWLVVAVITCVIFGSTLNKCLTCYTGDTARATPAFVPPVRGAPLDPGPVAKVQAPAEEPAEEMEEEEVGSEIVWEDENGEEQPEEEEPAGDKPKYYELTFELLASYVYEYPEIKEGGSKPENVKDQIPENIKALSGKKYAVKGFMIPIKTEGEQVVEFVLVRNQFFCCFGQVPQMNEWVHCTMAGDQLAPYAVDVPITVYGEFEVGELWENGVVMSLYRQTADKVVEPE